MQNILIAVNFQMNSIYVLARYEGTAYNSKVISSAKVKGFKALPSKYYIADARYSNTPIMLTPYHGI